MSNLVTIVEEYYQRVDAGDFSWVVDMFAEDGIYDRAGSLLKGRKEIEAFYKAGRKINVCHNSLKIWACGPDIFVEGSFQGKGADGSPRNGDFSDHWTFDENDKVAFRRTSLFSGSNYIRE